MIMPPPCLWIGAGERTVSTDSPNDCCQKYIPTFAPPARDASQMRGPETSAADCSQNEGFSSVREKNPFETMPWSHGSAAVRNVACATQVTAGNTDAAGRNVSPAIPWRPRRSRSS